MKSILLFFCRKGSKKWEQWGPGIITGAAGDDPAAIATYAQVGAAHGHRLLWTAFWLSHLWQLFKT